MKTRLNSYYLKDKKKLIDFLVPTGAKIQKIKAEDFSLGKKFDYLVMDNLIGEIKDVYSLFERVRKLCKDDTRLVITYYNHLWEPVLKLASILGWKKPVGELNWLDQDDIKNFLELTDFEVINSGKRLLIPVKVPYLSDLVNKWIAQLPVINSLCLTTWVTARAKPKKRQEFSVSIVIPARNEKGNISKALKLLPKFGKWQEVIFVEGHSKDNTWEKITEVIRANKRKNLRLVAFKQKGRGKADAVRLGFSKAKGELLMILDADLTVDPLELPKFYNALSQGQGEYINGSRMVYPMEKEAMRTLNILGNKIFSLLFTWILGQRFKDTLCGTKVMLKKDYLRISKGRKFFGDFDPFGDFDLIFGAVKQNLKVIEIPVRYKERTYGSTNISRFRHGWLLLKMTWFAFRKFRAW